MQTESDCGATGRNSGSKVRHPEARGDAISHGSGQQREPGHRGPGPRPPTTPLRGARASPPPLIFPCRRKDRATGSARASATIYPKGGPHGGPVAHLGWACRATGSAQGGHRRAVGVEDYGQGSPAAWTPSGVVLLLVFLVILRAPVEQGPRERPPSALVGFREQLPRQISRQRLPVPDVRRGTQSNAQRFRIERPRRR